MDTKSVNILLVEDNEDDVIMTLESFDEVNLANVVDVVSDGEEAMAYLRREGKYKDVMLPGIILLDINMPKKNGFEVLIEMKADPALRHIPVVVLTTSDREEDIIKSYAEGACSFIPKPVGFDNFIRVAKQFSLYWTLVARIPSRS
jgi:CheY-like chemotaxis protein